MDFVLIRRISFKENSISKSIIYAIVMRSENPDRVVKNKSEAKNQEVKGVHVVLENVLILVLNI